MRRCSHSPCADGARRGRATATRSADGSHYIVKGVKKWITNGHFAHYFATAVRTGGEGVGGVSLLLNCKLSVESGFSG